MRPAEEVAREWLDADGPSDKDMARYVRGNFFDPDTYEHARLTALIEAARREGAEEMRERSSAVAVEYGSVNWQMCTDSILLDPVLRGDPSPEAFARSESMQIDGTIHSAAYHAAEHIAAAIRALPVEGEKK